MERAIPYKLKLTEEWKFVCLAFVGCGLITLGSLVRVPFYPVPFTLQTLAIVILALTQSPKQAFGSAVCYLLCATVGLPVLSGHANPLWIVGKTGGYLVAFPLASYLIAKIAQRFSVILGVLCGQFLIYALGFLWLVPFFGAKIAFLKGVVLFIPGGLLKSLIAIGIAHRWKKWRGQG